MKSGIIPENEKRLTDLVTYIERHRHEIINYELRRSVGKTMGSGRRKKKGMRWEK